jgi:NAD(P)-dependent dehydrogenase (short-subunit alcohol dehydrogenase family)
MSTKTVALVTGGNKGIGLETSRQLAQQGITVLLGARDAGRGEQAAATLRDEGLDVQYIPFDATNPATHKAAAETIEKNYGKLDILVNNAGIAPDFGTKTSTIPPALLRETFDTNFFGLIEATQTLLPLVAKSDAGRIVNVSSILGSLGTHSQPDSPISVDFLSLGYNASKTALNAFTVHLARELAGTNIKVNSAHPGWVKTDLGSDAAPLETPEGAETSVWLATLPADGPTGGFFFKKDTLPW